MAGYRVALDGYAAPEVMERLLRYVNFVKVDFGEAQHEDHAQIRELIAHSEVKLIAQKIESWKEFEWARAQNYAYFQGHFFLEPQILKRRELAGSAMRCMELLRLVNERPMDLAKVEDVLMQEPALMYKLLRFLNSPLMARAVEVKSVHSAIALLGIDEFRRWASLVAVITPAAEKPSELIRTGLTRAFFCEALSRVRNKRASSFEYFLTGLFSVMSALLDRPLADITAEMAVSTDVRDALGGKPNELRHAMDAAVAFEGGRWEDFAEAMDRLKLDEQNAQECMEEADRIVRELQA
jgi:EAL and modified HD-GYP domain-containing signal transduction protein